MKKNYEGHESSFFLYRGNPRVGVVLFRISTLLDLLKLKVISEVHSGCLEISAELEFQIADRIHDRFNKRYKIPRPMLHWTGRFQVSCEISYLLEAVPSEALILSIYLDLVNVRNPKCY